MTLRYRFESDELFSLRFVRFILEKCRCLWKSDDPAVQEVSLYCEMLTRCFLPADF